MTDPNDAVTAAARSAVGSTVSPAVEVVRSEERVVAGREVRVSGTVRIGKRVVTEERTVTVTVRREELFVEQLGAEGGAGGPVEPAPRDPSQPVVTITLSEEEPVVGTRVVPREVVRLYVDRVTTDVRLDADVAREVVELDVDSRPDR
jgi:uncharacterized protein (TIGR02271 family)